MNDAPEVGTASGEDEIENVPYCAALVVDTLKVAVSATGILPENSMSNTDDKVAAPGLAVPRLVPSMV